MAQIFQNPCYPRLFSLEKCGLHSHAKPSQVFASIRGGTLLQLTSPMQVVGHPTIGVYADACLGNGTPSAERKFGLYFRPNSRYNRRGRLPIDQPQTSQRVELNAVISALEQIEVVNAEDRALELFIIVVDSEYVINSITNYINEWKRDDWKISNAVEVANRDLWEFLDTKLDRLSNQEHDIDVLFWHVPMS
jgi:ribonuclease HI